LSRASLSRRALIVVPVLMVFWANLHGSFPVGFAMLGLMLLGRAITVIRAEGWSARAVWRDEAARRLAIALAASAVAVAILNPYGPTLYIDVIRFSGHPNLRTMAEWQPLDFTQARGGHWEYLATVAVVLATPLATRRLLSPTQWLLVIMFGVWPIFQQRAMIWWAPLVPWIVAPHWVVAAERWKWVLPENVPSFRKTALAALLVVVVLIASPASTWIKTGRPRAVATALHRGTPYDIAATLNGQPPADSGRVAKLVEAVHELPGGRLTGPIFASESQGEYLLWALPADRPVMMYNHAQLFEPGYWSQCMTVKQAGAGWSAILDRYQAQAVVVEIDYQPQLCDALRQHPGWGVVVDESDTPGRNADSRLFVALRKPTK